MAKEKLYHYHEWLKRKYVDEDLSIYKIADICGVSPSSVARYVRRYGLKKGRQKPTMIRECHVYYPDYLYDSLMEYADSTGQSISQVTRTAVIEHLTRNNANPLR